MADLEAIRARYPAYSFLLDDQEIGWLLSVAVDKGMDDQEFQARLMTTNWWKTHSEAQRNYYAKLNTDPAEAEKTRGQWRSELDRLGRRNGVAFSSADLDWWTDLYVPQGIQVTDPLIQSEIARVFQQRPDLRWGGAATPIGDIAAVGDQIKQLADGYLRDLTDADVSWWQREIASGNSTVDGLRTVLQNQAKDRFGFYAEQIEAGSTPAQLFSDRREAIARELEMDSSAVDLLHDPRWSKVLGTPDKDGRIRPMTFNETVMLARQQDEWKQTRNGQTLGAGLTQSLLKEFGEIG